MGVWTTEAKIQEIHPTSPNFYKLLWITRGLSKEEAGTISSRYHPSTALKKMDQPAEKVQTSRPETMTGGSDENNGSVKQTQPANGPVKVTLKESGLIMRKMLTEVSAGKRMPMHNENASCHVDTFLFLEMAAFAKAPCKRAHTAKMVRTWLHKC